MEQWTIIIVSLLVSAFFSGIEIAFFTANKLRIELESKQDYLPSQLLSRFLKQPSKFIATTLVGNNIALVVYGIVMAEILEPQMLRWINSAPTVLAIQTVISTLILLITAEFLPKALFRINPNRSLTVFIIPFMITYYLLYPIVLIASTLSEFILTKVLRIKLSKEKMVFGRTDLQHYVKQSTTDIEDTQKLDHEIQIFQNALDFSAIKVRECMIPRTEIIAMEVNDSMEELRQKFVETKVSKILIYQDSIDNIIGYTHSYELFKRPQNLRSILLPVAIIPETMAAKDVLTLLIQQHKSIAVVVDEFGGTAGIITIEDIMEEIFGEIEDEHDKEELTEKQINENEYIFSGRIEIDYLNDKYKLDLPVSENYETLAGLIIEQYQSIPQVNEEVRYDKFLFKIIAVSGTRIEQVQLKILKEVT